MRSLVFLGVAGCGGSRPPCRPPAPTECGPPCFDTLTRVERIDLAGNPAVGTIVHLRQLHRTGAQDDEASRELGRYQYEIFRELQRQDFQDVFVETLPFPQTCPVSSPSTGVLNGQNVLGYYTLGGAAVYANTRHGVTLRPTQTPEETAIMLQSATSLGLQELMDLNESFAPPHVSRFLRTHPGSRAALVFGAGHDFADNFARTYPNPQQRPVLISVCWRVPGNWALAPLINPHCPL